MNKCKKIILLLSFIISIFLLIGCSKTKEYTEFQNAYFQICKGAENDESFNKEDLEKLTGQMVSNHKSPENKEDYNVYIFEVNDEQLKICIKSDNKLAFIEYSKLGEITLANNLETNTAIGEYGEGCTSNIKPESIEQQQKIFDEINN